MFNVTQDLKQTRLHQHFMHRKLEIAYAIAKPFPFFEGLRDKSFITEKMYLESLEACRNAVPVPRVVYNILSKLEEKFNLSLLEMLFSEINLREYPRLKAVLWSFKNVVFSRGGWDRATLTVLDAPANQAGRSSHQTLLPLPAPQRPPPRRPAPEPATGQPRAISLCSTTVLDRPPGPAGAAKALPSVLQKGRTTPGSSGNLTPQAEEREDVQEVPCPPSALVPETRTDSPEPREPGEPQEAASTPPVRKGKKRKRSIWDTPRKRHQKKSLPRGPTLPEHRIQRKLQVADQATQKKDKTRNTKVVTGAQTSGPEEVSDDSSEVSEVKSPWDPPSTPPRMTQDALDHGRRLSLGKSPREKQKMRKKCSWSSSKTRQKTRLSKGTASSGHRAQEKTQVVDQATQKKDNSTRNTMVVTRAQKARIECAQKSRPREKKRGKDVRSSSTRSCQKNIPPKEKPKDETVDFQSPTLPVTCGDEKGILHKDKLKKGSSEPSIQNEAGVWFTPREFEVKGRGIRSKNWKRNVRCRGETLQRLLEKGLLLCPPRISLKRERESPDECEVCCRGGQLLSCDTCPRAFHEDCHIPLAEAERSPWSCTFCRMKETSGSRQCLREPEVLERQMGPEEQLKCEFLLLKAYCHPQSAFFAKSPHNIQDYAEPFKEAMWLDLVKERLTEKVYTVAWFVRDMRLIFHNHKTFYKASDFGQVGLDLQAKFEKDLKEVFMFHEANENYSHAPP
ncbi:sp110 nuclear body protein isoform 2-T2 [Molossus nigricans]